MNTINFAQNVRANAQDNHADEIQQGKDLISRAVREVYAGIQVNFKYKRKKPEISCPRDIEIFIFNFPQDLSLRNVLEEMGFSRILLESSIRNMSKYSVSIPRQLEGMTQTPAQSLYAEHVSAMKKIEADIAAKNRKTCC